ncbi:MAG: hypothetical protein WD009_05725 [Phycisphaeraceae bacterium]
MSTSTHAVSWSRSLHRATRVLAGVLAGAAMAAGQADGFASDSLAAVADEVASGHGRMTADETYTSEAFELEAGRVYSIYTHNLSSGADTILHLHRVGAPDDLYGSSRPIQTNDDFGGGWASNIIWRADQTANYHIRVEPWGDDVGTFEYRVVDLGEQSLVYERENASLDDGPLNFGDFRLEADKLYLIGTFELQGNTDTRIQLRTSTDPDRARDGDPVIAEDDDGGEGYASMLLHRPMQAAECYVHVAPYDDTGAGTFSIRIYEFNPELDEAAAAGDAEGSPKIR